MTKKSEEIPDITFLKSEANFFDFDLFAIENLFNRLPKKQLEKVHRIHFYLLLYITEGIGSHFIDFNEIAYKPGNLICVAENQVHKFAVNLDTRGYAMLFTKDFFYQSPSELNILQKFRVFDPLVGPSMIALEGDKFRTFKMLFEVIDAEHQRSNAFKSEIIHSLVKSILLKAEKEIRKQSNFKGTRKESPEFTKFRECLEENYSKTRNVQDFGRLLGFSPKKINKIAKQATNQTGKVLIDNRVILEAKRLLAHTSLSVSEISEKVGFDEPTNLVKFFKKHVNQTPTAFRAAQ